MDLAGLETTKAGGGDAPGGFACARREFVRCLNASAACDRRRRTGQAHRAVHKKRAVGHAVLATGGAGSGRQEDLGIGAHGPMPALMTARPAADEPYEGRGTGGCTASCAARLARTTAAYAGCRAVPASSEPGAAGFCESMGFAGLGGDRTCEPGSIRRVQGEETGAEGRRGAECASMHIDAGPGGLRAGRNGGLRGRQQSRRMRSVSWPFGLASGGGHGCGPGLEEGARRRTGRDALAGGRPAAWRPSMGRTGAGAAEEEGGTAESPGAGRGRRGAGGRVKACAVEPVLAAAGGRRIRGRQRQSQGTGAVRTGAGQSAACLGNLRPALTRSCGTGRRQPERMIRARPQTARQDIQAAHGGRPDG